jgi:hypothetical protein
MSHKTAEFIEQTKAQSEKPENREKTGKPKKTGFRGPHPDVGKATQFKPGVCANPGGRPKRDIAADIARAVFESSEGEAIAAFRKALLKGNAYTYKELAERGYGKLKEVHEVKHIHEDVADGDLQSRIDGILRDLGLAREIEEARGTEVSDGRAEKTNGKAKDTPVLS